MIKTFFKDYGRILCQELDTQKMPQSPLVSFEYLVQNELQQEFINGVPIMTHPTVNSNVKSTSMKPGYQVFRPQQQQQQSTSKDNIEVWLHGPR